MALNIPGLLVKKFLYQPQLMVLFLFAGHLYSTFTNLLIRYRISEEAEFLPAS